jgi:hypothetical protein
MVTPELRCLVCENIEYRTGGKLGCQGGLFHASFTNTSL